jgi:integrase
MLFLAYAISTDNINKIADVKTKEQINKDIQNNLFDLSPVDTELKRFNKILIKSKLITFDLKETKKYLVLLSLDTCIRKSAILRLKWSDFEEAEDGIVIKGIDKGNTEFRKKISKEFYNELLTIKKTSDKVFNVNDNVIDGLMKRYREFFKISPDRKIVWHSVRKAGIMFRFRLTKDILEAQKAAGHKNINTTQIYLQSEDYGAIGAVSSMGKLDNELFKKVDHETLINAIGLLNQDTQLLINLKLNEILKK